MPGKGPFTSKPPSPCRYNTPVGSVSSQHGEGAESGSKSASHHGEATGSGSRTKLRLADRDPGFTTSRFDPRLATAHHACAMTDEERAIHLALEEDEWTAQQVQFAEALTRALESEQEDSTSAIIIDDTEDELEAALLKGMRKSPATDMDELAAALDELLPPPKLMPDPFEELKNSVPEVKYPKLVSTSGPRRNRPMSAVEIPPRRPRHFRDRPIELSPSFLMSLGHDPDEVEGKVFDHGNGRIYIDGKIYRDGVLIPSTASAPAPPRSP